MGSSFKASCTREASLRKFTHHKGAPDQSSEEFEQKDGNEPTYCSNVFFSTVFDTILSRFKMTSEKSKSFTLSN